MTRACVLAHSKVVARFEGDVTAVPMLAGLHTLVCKLDVY